MANQRDTETFSDHPLNMLSVECGIGNLGLYSLPFQHFQKPFMRSWVMSRVAENGEPPIQRLGRQFRLLGQGVILADANDQGFVHNRLNAVTIRKQWKRDKRSVQFSRHQPSNTSICAAILRLNDAFRKEVTIRVTHGKR